LGKSVLRLLINEKNLAECPAPELPTDAALKGRSFSCAVQTAFYFFKPASAGETAPR
jgi:hypothetical protein